MMPEDEVAVANFQVGVEQGRFLEKQETEARLIESASMLSDSARYKALRMIEPDDRPACPVKDCALTAVEHHLLAYGMLAENKELKRRIDALEHGTAT